MRPKQLAAKPQDALFRARLQNLVDPQHALVRLAGLIDWSRNAKPAGMSAGERIALEEGLTSLDTEV